MLQSRRFSSFTVKTSTNNKNVVTKNNISAMKVGSSIFTNKLSMNFATDSKSELMEKIKLLRKTTNAPLHHCKTALEEEKGDIEKAKDWLRKKGVTTASKKSGRTAAEGLVALTISSDKKDALLVEVNSETDFVSMNESFQKLVSKVAGTLLREKSLQNVEDLKQVNISSNEQEGSEVENITVQQAITDVIGSINENIQVRRFKRLSISNSTEGVISTYMHNSINGKINLGKIGCLVALQVTGNNAASIAKNPELEDLGQKIAMHITAFSPVAVNKEGISKDLLDRELAIIKEQVLTGNQGKPENIIDKMVQGRLGKFMEESVLLEQKWVMDDKLKVSKVLQEASSRYGATIQIAKFEKFVVGEGIEKESVDFASEVKKAANL